jgi:hypothetical protein
MLGRAKVRAGVAGLVAAAACAGGCALKPKPALSGSAATGVKNPFGPATLSIHPLTRVDRDEAGRLWIICHIELRDVWGDSCKGAGKLQVQLYKPTGGRAGGPGIQELTWDVDLSDLKLNASLYDPATRTYRLPLEDPPAWLVASTTDRKSDLPIARLKAVLVTTGVKGDEKILTDEFALGL